MVAASGIPIPYRIIALMQERNRIFEFPLEHMAVEIEATGFQCTRCGACCTRAVNGHILLLDHEIAEVKKLILVHSNQLPILNFATRMVYCIFRDIHSVKKMITPDPAGFLKRGSAGSMINGFPVAASIRICSDIK